MSEVNNSIKPLGIDKDKLLTVIDRSPANEREGINHMDFEFVELKKGEVLIEEGTVGSEVFLFTEGLGEVWKDGVKVGQLEPNEIFGVTSALTGKPRTATILCGSDTAFAMRITREQFQSLIKEKPELVEKLILDMSRIIEDLNSKYVNISKKP